MKSPRISNDDKLHLSYALCFRILHALCKPGSHRFWSGFYYYHFISPNQGISLERLIILPKVIQLIRLNRDYCTLLPKYPFHYQTPKGTSVKSTNILTWNKCQRKVKVIMHSFWDVVSYNWEINYRNCQILHYIITLYNYTRKTGFRLGSDAQGLRVRA